MPRKRSPCQVNRCSMKKVVNPTGQKLNETNLR